MGLFQQPCVNASSQVAFYDQFALTGAPDGTPISIQFNLTTSGSVSGFGGWGYGATLSDGWDQVGNYDGTGGTVSAYNQTISQTNSWVGTYNIGATYALIGNMYLGAFEDNCPAGSQNCGQMNTIMLDLSHTSLASAEILTPGVNIQMISASGYD